MYPLRAVNHWRLFRFKHPGKFSICPQPPTRLSYRARRRSPIVNGYRLVLACLSEIIRLTNMRNLSLFTLFILLSNDIFADSFRCGRKIVKSGDSGNMLIRKCGKPAWKFSSKQKSVENGRVSNVPVSNWVYERRGKRDMIVSVRNGAIVNIQIE